MWIAAWCLAYEAPLATLNLKDYEDFTEYHGLPLLGAPLTAGTCKRRLREQPHACR